MSKSNHDAKPDMDAEKLPTRAGWGRLRGQWGGWYYRRRQGALAGDSDGACAADAQSLPAERGSVDSILVEQPGFGWRQHEERSPHVLVCIEGLEEDLELIEHGRLLAGLLEAALTVLHPFRPGDRKPNRELLSRVRVAARTAGAPLVDLPSYSVLDGIIEYVEKRDITHLVLTMPAQDDGRLRRLLQGVGSTDVYLVAARRP